MKTYYDRLNETFGFFESNILPSSAQLVMLWLLHFNNRFGNTGQFYLSDNRLSLLTNLSKGTITNTKRVLKNLGLIDFKSNKDSPRQGTLYILPEEGLITDWAKNWAKRGQNWGKPWGTSSPTPANSSTSISNNNTKKEKELDRDLEIDSEKKRARDVVNNIKDIEEDRRVEYFGLPLDPKLQDKWEKNTRNGNRNLDGKLTDYEFTRLSQLQEKYGIEKLDKAMDKALGYNNAGLNHLETSLEKLRERGAEKRDDTSEYAGLWGDDDSDDTNEYANLW